MCDTAYMVDEILFLLVMIELMKYWFFMLLRPMLFIDTITICPYDTCTTNMLVKIHKGSLEEGKNTITNTKEKGVGRLVVVIDVNPSHGFWTTRLMKLFGHEGKCTCRYNTHGWIVYIMLFPVVCGTSRGSSWLRRNEFLKMTK
jgi:hypothetical protein